ncbi:unnamed protein product [Rhizopus microsporus]
MDENSSAVWEQVMEQLRQTFAGFKVSKSTLHDFVRKRCNLSQKSSVDRATYRIGSEDLRTETLLLDQNEIKKLDCRVQPVQNNEISASRNKYTNQISNDGPLIMKGKGFYIIH